MTSFMLEHGEVGALVLEDDVGLELALVGQRDLHLGGIVDDVIVGDDQPVRADDHARAERALHPLARHGRAAEELLEQRIVEQGRRARALDMLGVDVDDRRDDALDERREGELPSRPCCRGRPRASSAERRGGRDKRWQTGQNLRFRMATAPARFGAVLDISTEPRRKRAAEAALSKQCR